MARTSEPPPRRPDGRKASRREHPPRQFLGIRFADIFAERRRAGISFAVGLIVLLLLQVPVLEQSFLGEPDREMMQAALRLRADRVGGTADPVLFMDIDNQTISEHAPPFTPPPATAPRAMIANLLDFIRASPPADAPKAVILDVDVAEPASDGDEGVAKLKAALAAWAAARTAPPLLIARGSYPGAAVGVDSPGQVLPDTPYDAVVAPASNIRWSEARMLGDMNGVIREFLPFECVLTSAGEKPLYSAALMAYLLTETDRAALTNAERHWVQDAASRCQSHSAPAQPRGELIDYHLSMETAFARRVWPDLSPRWPGFATCGHSDTRVFLPLSAIVVLDALSTGAPISSDVLCRRIVIIGGTNTSAGDFEQTPLNEMNGSAVLANAVRGLQLTRGGLKRIPLIGQVLLLALVSLAISASTAATSRARKRYVRVRGRVPVNRLSQLAILPLFPIALNGMIALAAHWVGVALLLVSLNFGLWGFLSGPAIAVAVAETIQELTDA
jgi:CHASE2 domain-containing sensor protein